MTRDDFETLFSYLDADNSGACENTHTHSFSLSLSLSLSLTHTHTQNIHKHTHTLSLSLSLTHKQTRTGDLEWDLDWAEFTMVAKQASFLNIIQVANVLLMCC